MKANEPQINNFLQAANMQFVIPVYQPNYDWRRKECRELLNDGISVEQEKRGTHFSCFALHSFEERQLFFEKIFKKSVFQGNLNTTTTRNFSLSIPPLKNQKETFLKTNPLLVFCYELVTVLETSISKQEKWMENSLRKFFEGKEVSNA